LPVAWEYQNTVHALLYISNPIVGKNRGTPGLICSRISLSSASKLHVGIGSSGILIPNVTRAVAFFSAAKTQDARTHIPGRICVSPRRNRGWRTEFSSILDDVVLSVLLNAEARKRSPVPLASYLAKQL